MEAAEAESRARTEETVGLRAALRAEKGGGREAIERAAAAATHRAVAAQEAMIASLRRTAGGLQLRVDAAEAARSSSDDRYRGLEEAAARVARRAAAAGVPLGPEDLVGFGAVSGLDLGLPRLPSQLGGGFDGPRANGSGSWISRRGSGGSRAGDAAGSGWGEEEDEGGSEYGLRDGRRM